VAWVALKVQNSAFEKEKASMYLLLEGILVEDMKRREN
jgi:hypothetical protein